MQVGARSEAVGASRGRPAWLVPAGLVLAVTGLVILELASFRFGFRGPTTNFFRDLVAGPKRGPVCWAALGLALVSCPKRARITCLVAAATLDLAFFLGRLPGHGRPTFGNGALWVLVFLGAWANARWDGEQRAGTLRGVFLGLIMVFSTKVSDAWLRITALTQHNVLDEYVLTADRALGNPSWLVGRMVQSTGIVGHRILETVYIQLPIAAILVVAWQLRKGWPSHHLVRTFLAIGIIGPACYVLFPVVGPVFAFGSAGRGWAVANVWPAVSSLPLRPNGLAFDAITPRNCMPSLHTAWVVAIFVHTRREPRWLRNFGTFWMVATLIATLGFGYHYGVDLVAGAVFALTVEAALRDPERGWGWFRWRLVGGGAATLAGLLVTYRYLCVPMARFPVVFGPLLLGVVVASAVAFYATFFAPEGSAAYEWGHPELAEERPDLAASTVLG